MAAKEKGGGYRLTVPLDASGVKDFKPEKAVKVAAFDNKGRVHEATVKLDGKGIGTAILSFDDQPGSLRVVVGPEDASAEQLQGLQTISISVSTRNWQGKTDLDLAPILISSYYWWWWLWWCRNFTIRGKVVCADGSPVPGAQVCAYDVDWWWWWVTEELVGCATTDATGSFEIDFRWCCGWWPWWWWARRFWRLEPLLVGRILPVLERDPKIPRIPTPDPAPDFSVFDPLLRTSRAGTLAAVGKMQPQLIESLRTRLLENLHPSAELAQLRIWPWWPWWPWWDCTPDIIFKVTQNCKGQDQTILTENIWDTRWDIPTTLNLTLVANDQACCVHPCTKPSDCPDGNCLVITDACEDLVATIGGNPGAPATPAGYLNPGGAASSGDRPYGGTVSISGIFGAAATADYYEFEWSNNGGITWNPMPPAAAGGFTRWFWGPGLPAGPVGWHPVSFPFTPMSGHNVIESRQHFEANNDAANWGVTRFWDAATENLLMYWLTDGNFADGTYQLRTRSWQLVGGALKNDVVLPLCDTASDNGLVLTLDNRYVNPAGPTDSNGHACGPGTVHTCTTEPDTAIVAVRINGNPVDVCATVDAAKGGTLEIDFMAWDPDGHLAYYTLQATYGNNLAIDLLSVLGASLSAGPPVGAVPSAGLLVGPDYGTALGQGAVSPNWKGGIITLTITDLHKAFPETCCYQLQLYAHKRTVVSCDHSLWGQTNLSEYSFTVVV